MIKILLAFILGAVAGSFANCCIWRLPREESIISPPSHCPGCHHRLGILDLFPIISYLWLGGKCRYCQAKIGLKYLMVELILGILFSVIVVNFYRPLEIFFYFFLAIVLIIVTFIDLEHQILPDSLTFLAAAGGLVFQLLINPAQIGLAFYSGLGAGLFMFLLSWISSLIWKQETLGGGDIKLAVAFGFIFSWPQVILALFLSFFVGAIIGLFLIFFMKKSRKDYMPFGPSMVLGALITIFWGDFLTRLYWQCFLIR